jgi:hypothetical protein
MNEEVLVIATFGPFLGWAVFYLGLSALEDSGFPLAMSIFMIVVGPLAILVAALAAVGSYPLLVVGSFTLGALPAVMYAVKAYAAAWQS